MNSDRYTDLNIEIPLFYEIKNITTLHEGIYKEIKLHAFLITYTVNEMSNFNPRMFTNPIATLKRTDYEDDFAPGLILTLLWRGSVHI